MSKVKYSLVLLTLAGLLAGCSGASNPSLRAFEGLKPTCDQFKGGPEIDTVQVSVKDNAAPEVTFVITDKKKGTVSALANIKTAQTKIIKEGTGPKFTGDELVIIEYALYNSTTGQLEASSNFDGTNSASQVFNSSNMKLYCDAMTGVPEGSLFMFALPKDADDKDGSLFVLDLKKVYLPHANGDAKSPESGFPQVVLDPKTKQPGLIKPTFGPPKESKHSVLVEGKGEEIKEGDSITVHYTGWIWNDSLGSVFDSSWDRGTPETFNVSQLIPGMTKALIGAKVGSQIVAVMPPEDGYGAQGNASVPGNSTLLFVVDILGINK